MLSTQPQRGPMDVPVRDRAALSVVCAVLALCVATTGCRSNADYAAAELPTGLRVSGPTSTQSVDLSTIARHSINADLIYPGDVLDVTVATGIEDEEPQSWPLRVTDEGMIDVPLVGQIRVAGVTLVDAENEIRRASVSREIYRSPHVAVLMRDRRKIRVRVVGAVETPGVYDLPAAGSDLLAALVAAGGLNDDAGTLVEIRHPNATQAAYPGNGQSGVVLASFVETPDRPERVVRIDLANEETSSSQKDLHVEDGTVVMVMEKPSHSVSVIGLVQRPDNYDLPADETLRVLDAIALAGGRTVSIADNVQVIRRTSPDEDPIVISVSVKQAKQDGSENLTLAPGDIVSVEETPVTFVVQTVRNFIRFGFTSAIPGL